jgi:hypothetical protein
VAHCDTIWQLSIRMIESPGVHGGVGIIAIRGVVFTLGFAETCLRCGSTTAAGASRDDLARAGAARRVRPDHTHRRCAGTGRAPTGVAERDAEDEGLGHRSRFATRRARSHTPRAIEPLTTDKDR